MIGLGSTKNRITFDIKWSKKIHFNFLCVFAYSNLHNKPYHHPAKGTPQPGRPTSLTQRLHFKFCGAGNDTDRSFAHCILYVPWERQQENRDRFPALARSVKLSNIWTSLPSKRIGKRKAMNKRGTVITQIHKYWGQLFLIIFIIWEIKF